LAARNRPLDLPLPADRSALYESGAGVDDIAKRLRAIADCDHTWRCTMEEAAAALERMLNEVASAEAWQVAHCHAQQSAEAEVARLTRELEAAQEDAARYRWLRDLHNTKWSVTRWVSPTESAQLYGPYLDAAIDAAIKAGEGK
jgi:formate-dependent nitrite reductase cytochrome c552 subunit